MSARFVNIDRETPMLLPKDLREGMRGDDLAHFVLEAVGGWEMEGALIKQHGIGSETCASLPSVSVCLKARQAPVITEHSSAIHACDGHRPPQLSHTNLQKG
jgi:hypothetical protein